MRVTTHLRVSGRVQGVGFRAWLRREALREGVAGWVRNRRDGTVEAVLQGEAEAVEALVRRARLGPPAARVTGVTASPAPPELARAYEGFVEMPTL